jgi:hypothetical protein
MPLDSDIIKKVSAEVYRQFPAVSGSKPKVQPYTDDQYLVIFQGSKKAANGKAISTTVRAVVSSSGKIIKLSTSR